MQIPEALFLKIQKMRGAYSPFGDRKIIFLHPPKCGGTSITQALKLKSLFSYYDMNNAATMRVASLLQANGQPISVQTVRKIMILDAVERNRAFICGHFDFDNELFSSCMNQYDFITLLRNPVDRFISQYYFNHIQIPLTEFLETDRARAWASDYVTRFSGGNGPNPELASSNLKKFSLIGKLENLPALESKFNKKYNKKLRVPRFNVGHRKRPVQDDILEKIKELCTQDIKLYEEI